MGEEKIIKKGLCRMTVKELIQSEYRKREQGVDDEEILLDEEFLQILPTECPDCGADLTISDTLKELSCSNSMCRGKIAKRMESMLADMGVKNMGENRCLAYVDATGATSPMHILGYQNGAVGEMSEAFMQGIKDQLDTKRTMMLWEYIKFSNIPFVRDTARQVFDRYTDLNKFYDDLDKVDEKLSYGGIRYIQQLLGIKENSATFSIKAINVYMALTTYRETLLNGLNYVNILVPAKTLNICISKAVGSPYTSKQNFIEVMNNKCGEQLHINFLGSVSKNCDYLVWSKEGPATSKVKKATSLGIPIVTGAEFEEIVRGMLNET